MVKDRGWLRIRRKRERFFGALKPLNVGGSALRA
jgi:hypothetical protein